MIIFKACQGFENFYLQFQDFPYFSRICTNPVVISAPSHRLICFAILVPYKFALDLDADLGCIRTTGENDQWAAGTGPAYFKHVCTPASDISGRAHLRSAERRNMLVPRTRTELGQRSFTVAAPTVWNSLPAHLRSTLISHRGFRDGLKSHLFADAYF